MLIIRKLNPGTFDELTFFGTEWKEWGDTQKRL